MKDDMSRGTVFPTKGQQKERRKQKQQNKRNIRNNSQNWINRRGTNKEELQQRNRPGAVSRNTAVRIVKIQISLRVLAGVLWVAKITACSHVDSEDSNQPSRTCNLKNAFIPANQTGLKTLGGIFSTIYYSDLSQNTTHMYQTIEEA